MATDCTDAHTPIPNTAELGPIFNAEAWRGGAAIEAE
jgi:hypothetical protein